MDLEKELQDALTSRKDLETNAEGKSIDLPVCYGDGDWCHSLCARGSNVGSGTAVGQHLHSHTDC